MAEKENETKRRRRVNRLKKTVVVTVLLSILIPWAICAILLVKVHTLKEEVTTLETKLEIAQEEKNPEETSTQGDHIKESKTEETSIDEALHGGEKETQQVLAMVPLNEEEETQPPVTVEEKGRIYLTFDDGPSDNTDAILDLLSQYGIKATFFVVGKEDEKSLATYRRIVEEGHTLGMHSYSHSYQNIYDSQEAFLDDFEKLKKLLVDTTGVEPKFYRFPGGSSNTVSKTSMYTLIQCLHEKGVEYYDWNVASGDAMNKMPTVDEMVNNVINNVPIFYTSIILFHDASNKPLTVEALPKIIESLKETGYQFYPIDDSTKLVQHIKTEE